MIRLFFSTRVLTTGVALAGLAAQPAVAQFVAVNNYAAPTPPATQPAYGQAAPVASYGARPYPAAAGYGVAPQAAYPRVAQAGDLPAPAESIGRAAAAATTQPEITPQVTAQPAPAAYAAPTMSPTPSYTGTVTPAASYPTASYPTSSSHASYPVASSGCATGNCGTSTATPLAGYSSYPTAGCDSYCAPSCDTAPACDLAPVAPRRQWFAGIYGLFLDRAGDSGKSAVAYLTDTAGFGGGTDYYAQPSDPTLFTTDAGQDGLWGAEVRFGSTFGCDPCGCSQPFAWEVGYWAIDDDSSAAQLILPGAVSDTFTQRLYTMPNYYGVNADLDGAGTTWADRPVYIDPGDPAPDDIYDTDVRILGVRVRQRFQAQNLELNFWRFGTPTVAAFGSGFGAGTCGAGGCGGGYASCGAGGCGDGACGPTCAPAACAPCRPPRRFFINGLAGVRYLRVDDDFGFDTQFAIVDVPPSGNAGNVPVGLGWTDTYTGFPVDDIQTMFSDFEANNELVGFQLGCSMNWLVGCRWNLFADTNMGIYGNSADVYKRVYGGGGAVYTFANDGGAAEVRGSETNVAFVGELRAGVGYQLTCNCRLTAAYRFLGVGGVALGVEEFQNTDWSNRTVASHIDTNNSIILHGLQTGVECKF